MNIDIKGNLFEKALNLTMDGIIRLPTTRTSSPQLGF